MPISVSIIEDDSGLRETLTALLNGSEGFRCLGAYATGEKGLAGILADKPDVVLMDINLPGMSGIECVAKLKARLPALHVLMLTTYEEGDLIFNSLRAGAGGYLLKDSTPEELLQALADVRSGGAPMSMPIARKVVQHFHRTQRSTSDIDQLSPREYEILSLLAKGYRYKEIAARLDIAIGTLRTHQSRIYEKLHVQSRTEATVKFLGGRNP
ncbi:MAG TPA: response regulator transcription factor [Opitutaceae bacterium]